MTILDKVNNIGQNWTTKTTKTLDNIGQNWTKLTNLDKWTKLDKIVNLGQMDNYAQLWTKQTKLDNNGQMDNIGKNRTKLRILVNKKGFVSSQILTFFVVPLFRILISHVAGRSC